MNFNQPISVFASLSIESLRFCCAAKLGRTQGRCSLPPPPPPSRCDIASTFTVRFLTLRWMQTYFTFLSRWKLISRSFSAASCCRANPFPSWDLWTRSRREAGTRRGGTAETAMTRTDAAAARVEERAGGRTTGWPSVSAVVL